MDMNVRLLSVIVAIKNVSMLSTRHLKLRGIVFYY